MSEPNLFGEDLLGKPIVRPLAGGTLAKRFRLPPFSVLNAREGPWQDRKRAWIALGIQSEIGRGGNLLNLSDSCEEYRQAAGDYAGDPEDHKDPLLTELLPEKSLKGGLAYGLTQAPYESKEKVIKKRENWKDREENEALMSRGDLGVKDPTVAHDRIQGPSQPGLVNHLTLQAYKKRGAPVSAADCGTSIFDPVLCELVYGWFCPPGGTVLDPFAGGSVRGIVAGLTGRRYWGSELSAAQVAANRQQARDILPQRTLVPVKVSAAMARLRFNGCDPDYIRDVCHASCCRSSTAPGGALVSIHPSEEGRIRARGGEVRKGLLVVEDGCGFQSRKTHLCKLHGTGDKPFGCIASPFTVNSNGTLIVRNRYRLLKCYEDGNKVPAYVAFRASLDLLFGADEADRICRHFDEGGDDIVAQMPVANYRMLRDNDAAKKGGAEESPDGADASPVQWVCGDSRVTLAAAPPADFIMSCPPYYDLETYSKDPADLSNMSWEEFREAYAQIIHSAAEKLRDDRFACFVTGDVRDKEGNYRDLPGLTDRCFRRAGLKLYNRAILVTAVGSLSIRAARQFTNSRKIGTTHQYVTIYVKGDGKRAAQAAQGEGT